MIKKFKFKEIHFALPGYSSRSNGISILWNCAVTISKFIPVSISIYRKGDDEPLIFDTKKIIFKGGCDHIV